MQANVWALFIVLLIWSVPPRWKIEWLVGTWMLFATLFFLSFRVTQSPPDAIGRGRACGRVGCGRAQVWWGQRFVWCSSLTYLYSAGSRCLSTLLTITRGLCDLAAAQSSYTYSGPLSKKTCTTSPGVLPKRLQRQSGLQEGDLSALFCVPCRAPSSAAHTCFHPSHCSAHTGLVTLSRLGFKDDTVCVGQIVEKLVAQLLYFWYTYLGFEHLLMLYTNILLNFV